MWSLNVKNGDLNLGGPSGISTVVGTEKLLQDLRNWILEPIGTDPAHPNFGSSLDGGVGGDGQIYQGFIGGPINSLTLNNIEEELTRIMRSYQQQQIAGIQNEQALYSGKTHYSDSEILYRIDDIQTTVIQDKVQVRIIITTGTGQRFALSQALSNV
jgi:hypothetical protein